MRKSAFSAWLAVLSIAIVVSAAGPATCQYHEDDKWEERCNKLQPPQQVMDAIGVEKGMTVAEIGAGQGRYAVQMAVRVGSDGIIYANDIDGEALEYLRERCARDGIGNIETVMGEVDDPMLPGGEIDLVYVINSYHHFEDPVPLIEKVIHCLKPDGRLVIIEHDPDKYPKAGSHSTPQNRLIDEVYRAGFILIRIETFLERDNIYVFVPRSRVGG
jgi:ubiquinone/menaquinone biosynthesis C-methylase UbiE